jgi:hypothetical protein
LRKTAQKIVVVFGLAEDDSEDLDGKVEKLFEEIVEKPSFEAVRVGIIIIIIKYGYLITASNG